MRRTWQATALLVVVTLAAACGTQDGAVPAAGSDPHKLGASTSTATAGANQVTSQSSPSRPGHGVSVVGAGAGTVLPSATPAPTSSPGGRTSTDHRLSGTGVEVQLLDLACPPAGGPLTPCSMTPGRGVVDVRRLDTGRTAELTTGPRGTAVARTRPGHYAVSGRSSAGRCPPLSVDVTRHHVVHLDLYCGDD